MSKQLQDWPPEVSQNNWQKLRSAPVYCIDSWMFASLVTKLSDTVPQVLSSFCSAALSKDPSRRHSPAALLEPSVSQRLFSNNLILCDKGLSSLAIADASEKESFFQMTLDVLESLPASFVSRKLLSALIMLQMQQISLEGTKLILRASKSVSAKTFSSLVEPFFLALVEKPDRAIRLLLLDELSGLIDKMSTKSVQDILFAHFCTGFSDAMPELRERTLKASIILVPKLSTRQINSDLMRFYAKLQTDEQPGIRVNTVICLGKISKYLEPSTKSKVFGSAICKSLQDPFPPTRSSALLALMSTIESFSIEFLSRTILPIICGLLVDKDKGVRDQAFSSVRLIVTKIEDSFKKPISASKDVESGEEKVKTNAALEWGSWGYDTITKSVQSVQEKYKRNSVTSPKADLVTSPKVDSPRLTPHIERPKIAPQSRTDQEPKVVDLKVKSKPMALSRPQIVDSGWDDDLDFGLSPLETVIVPPQPEIQPEPEVSPVLNVLGSLDIDDDWGGSSALDPWADK